jgi:glutamyl-tRNA reductase
VQAIARTVVNRLLHEPTLKMKEMQDDRVHARMALVRDLFGLEVHGSELRGHGEDPMDELHPAAARPEHR